jgi:RNA polymerase sigma-70 factor (ECF subfamily)
MIDWQAISQQHSPLVWRTVTRLLGAGGADAADAFQETFVSALDVSRRQDVRNWPGLLRRLATMRALDQLRRRKLDRGRLKLVSTNVSTTGSSDVEQLVSRDFGPGLLAQQSELAEQLRIALAQLPKQQSEVFCLRHLNESSYEEIAEALSMSVDAVGVNLHRARQRLRTLLVEAGAVDVPRYASRDASRQDNVR